ncbi:MAG TPA: flagellar export chaperone FliS [Bryobacteraceae bacterium]|nr:flagellar export chaperone FliS [Bryobacteraceae bacterium]
MWQDAHDTYLESRVLSADPIELVRMLYQSAMRGVENARRHLAAGDIGARARSISHASAVVIELATSLDLERGGEISKNLAQLYDYMLRKLTEANLQQRDEPLAEVQGLLTTLGEGWGAIKNEEESAPAAAWAMPEPTLSADTPPGAWAPDPEPSAWEPVSGYGNSWSHLAAQETASYGQHDWSL